MGSNSQPYGRRAVHRHFRWVAKKMGGDIKSILSALSWLSRDLALLLQACCRAHNAAVQGVSGQTGAGRGECLRLATWLVLAASHNRCRLHHVACLQPPAPCTASYPYSHSHTLTVTVTPSLILALTSPSHSSSPRPHVQKPSWGHATTAMPQPPCHNRLAED